MSRGAIWTARVMATLAVLFLAFDTTVHVLKIQAVRDASGHRSGQ